MTISGSPVFWILLAMAILSVFIFLERLMELRRSQIDWQNFVNGIVNILERGSEDEALAICEDTPVPVAGIVATAIRHSHGSARVLREAVDARGRAETGRLDRRMASLAIIGQVAPGIGLIGTIIGFIKAVMLVDTQVIVSRPELLSAAVESMVSACLGLLVAVPVAVMYGMLRIRMERLVVELEAAASSIVGYISTREVRK